MNAGWLDLQTRRTANGRGDGRWRQWRRRQLALRRTVCLTSSCSAGSGATLAPRVRPPREAVREAARPMVTAAGE